MVQVLILLLMKDKILVKPNAPEGTKVLLEVGDMLVYSGCELEHWREPFEGTYVVKYFTL
jgi:hypothetical protein